MILPGSDGLTRRAVPAPDSTIQGKKVELQPGDRIDISVDGQTAHIVNSEGEIVGDFTAPRLYDDQGNELDARFVTYEDLLILAQTGITTRDACTKATVGKWTYRIGAAGVCTAAGLGLTPGAGAACGLGASGLEDQIPFDKVC